MSSNATPPSNHSSAAHDTADAPRTKKRKGRAEQTRGMGAVIWVGLGLLGALAVFYAWRTAANRESLIERNLRELDRIGRTVEGRVEGFAIGTQGWFKSQPRARDWTLVPYLLAEPEACAPDEPRMSLSERHVRFCYSFTKSLTKRTGGTFALDPLHQALHSEAFDVTFLADDSGKVFLTRGPGGIRLQEVPRDTARGATKRVSAVRTVTIAGREYQLFLQPLTITQSAPKTPEDKELAAHVSAMSWSLGGLVSTARFRGESLELGPRDLIFLGLLLILSVLALPFVRAALMGPWESISVRDVNLLTISLVLASGILGIAVADIQYFGAFSKGVDRNMAAAAGRLSDAFHGEIGRALRELNHWGPPQGTKTIRDSIRTHIFDNDTLMRRLRDPAYAQQRYLQFQMIMWIDPAGMQRAKWTPRAKNTRLLNVKDREYVRGITEKQSYSWHDPTGSRPKPYYLESIQSRTTGEKIAILSGPFCWDRDTVSCPAGMLGVRAMTTRLASLDSLMLPAGSQFAIVQQDGTTLFHSDPGRNLEEKFLEEVDDSVELRAFMAAHDSGTIRTTYMGRRSRLHIKPIEGTSLSLLMILDDGLPGTARFEAIFTSLAVFLAWAVIMWVAFMTVELLSPGRLRWAWPDRSHPWKYRLLTRLMAGFATLLVAQAVLAAVFRQQVHPSSFLVPIQALSVALLIESAGAHTHDDLAWRRSRAIGWGVLTISSVCQLALQLGSTSPLWYRGLLLAGQLGMVIVAAIYVATARRNDRVDQSEFPLERWYVVSIVMTLATVCVLPAYLIHEESFTQHRNRLIYHEQRDLQERAAQRPNRIAIINRDRGVPAVFDSALSVDSADMMAPPVLAARPRAIEAVGCHSTRSDLGALVFSRVQRRIPFVTHGAAEMRELDPAIGEGKLEICRHGLLSRRATTAAGSMTPLFARMSLVPAAGAVSFSRLLALLALLSVGIGVLVVLARWLARHLFLLDVPDSRTLTLKEQLARQPETSQSQSDVASMVVICTRSMDRQPLRETPGVHFVDLLKVDRTGDLDSVLAGDVDTVLEAAPVQQLLVLDHFDHRLDDPVWNGKLLLALESEVWLRNRKVVLMTSREPCALFPLLAHPEAEQGNNERWIRLLGQFVDVAVAELAPAPERYSFASASGAAPAQTLAEQALERECSGYRGLDQSAAQVRRRPDFHELTKEAVVQQLREMAHSYYHALWMILEPDERLVIAQVAHGVVANPKNRHAVRQLLARRLLVRDPELRLMNESFGRFVCEEVPASTVTEWERAGRPSAWQQLRFPIALALVAVVAFLFVTQRSVFDSAVAIVTAAGVATTAVLKLTTAVRLPFQRAD